MSTEAQQQRYRVIERLAAGGMAEVFVAESAGIEGFKKRVAIKRVLPHLSEKKRFIAMFLDEARLSANFSHSNVAQVFDIGVGDQTYFIVMEYVDGSDLKTVMTHLNETGRRFPIESALLICSKICEGLAYAHEQTSPEGVPLHAVHRDMSPPNVLISKHGEVKIVDFGLAKASTQLEKSEAGIIKGKFHYLSPEAAHGKEVDQRADIFAVGIILWEMLAGRRLFNGESDYQVVKAVQRCEVPRLSRINPEATPDIESILARALAKDPAQRYQTARALALDLTRQLFRLARPVDAFSLAELVRGTIMLRKPKEGGGASIIEKLIQETLFQFTSIKEEEGPKQEMSKPFALTGFDFEDFGQLADKAGGKAERGAKAAGRELPLGGLEEGNLSDALEGPDDRRSSPGPAKAAIEPAAERGIADELEGTGAHPSVVESVMRPKGEGAAPRSTKPTASTSGPHSAAMEPSARAGGSVAVKLIVLLIVAAATAAALHFSGMF